MNYYKEQSWGIQIYDENRKEKKALVFDLGPRPDTLEYLKKRGFTNMLPLEE